MQKQAIPIKRETLELRIQRAHYHHSNPSSERKKKRKKVILRFHLGSGIPLLDLGDK